MSVLEILNLEKALDFIDNNIKGADFNSDFVSELHRLAVEGLPPPPNGEGVYTPGIYRQSNVHIRGSAHIPPPPDDVQWYMDELYDFMNRPDEQKYDLLKIAISHHRFVWIHPFSNGNGRAVRLFTYAALVMVGFQVDKGRIINPSAIFCSDRNEYYRYLANADSGDKTDILSWCQYVLSGLKSEINKVDQLLDYKILQKNILLPALNYAREREVITHDEFLVLKKSC